MTITEPATDLAVVAARQAGRPGPRDPLGTPFLELETSVVAERLRALSQVFAGTAIHYAVRANPHPDVLATVVAAGANFDVASPAEVRACLAAGAAPDDLIYSNPVKRRHDIAEAAALGVHLFVVDSVPDVRKVAETAPGTAVVCRLVTLRDGSDRPLSGTYGCSVGETVDILRLAVGLGWTAPASASTSAPGCLTPMRGAPRSLMLQGFSRPFAATAWLRGCSTSVAGSPPGMRRTSRDSPHTER